MHICKDSMEGGKIETADITGSHTITVKALTVPLTIF